MSNPDLSCQLSSPLSTTTQPKNIPLPRTPHPPRLQHSPSLPNIWFPHNSSPTSREKDMGDTMQRPSAPSSPKDEPPASLSPKEPLTRHVKYASIDPTYRKPSGAKSHTRRRTERDEPHSLLTPPLTPSSSIRTTASSDSAASVGVQTGRGQNENISAGISDPDTESTRILLLENVSQDISVVDLESAIGDILASAAAEKNAAGEAVLSSTPTFSPHEVVKGINQRLHLEKGIVPVVFFDVRLAKIARDIINTKKLDGHLKECVDDGADGDDQAVGLTARLITLEELFKFLGPSRFLDGIDGSFLLRVQKLHHQDTEDVRTPTEHDAHIETEDKGGVKIAILQNILESYGSIRSFQFVQEEVDQQGVSSVVYRVEYHDLRDVETSYKDLKDRQMFGMKLTLSGGNADVEPAPKQQGPGDTHRGVSVEPFPNASTAGESFNGLPIRPAGTHSQMRQPFVCTIGAAGTAHEQPTADSASQTVTLPANPPSGGGSSPTYFYTTTPFDPGNHSLQVARHEQAAPICVRGPVYPDGGRASSTMPPHPVAQDQQWERDTIYRSDCISPCYGHDGACAYCPSRVPHNVATYNTLFPQYAFPPPTLTPSVYYTGHIPTPQIMPNMINIVPTPAPVMHGYEYMDPQMQPVHAGVWGYDPAIAAAVPGMNTPSPAPFFLREEAPVRAGARYNVAYTRPPSTPHANQSQQRQQPEAPEATAPQNVYASHRSTPPSISPSSQPPAPLASTEPTPATYQAGGASHDSNQLNLERILSGEDTRTTVMIKNIPNKMSDADLTEYISKVCPRRIDFLYLRMDFKNGCNVGYAFVNFIAVEDLLHFAKERLGAKWNMFSSEKVLQMSYANYQSKEALVEKFKNSAIMDERESWRPRIFYSSGPNQGLQEPFPAPTHIGRKERSSYNRGTLFPPGINSHSMASQSHGVLHAARRYREDAPRAVPQRSVDERYRGRQLQDGANPRRGDRPSTFRATSNRATR